MTTATMLTRYREPRRDKARNIVVHVNVGPEQVRGAANVARYTQLPAQRRGGSTGGYHRIVDNVDVVITAPDDEVVAGAGGANAYGWHICLVGFADQVPAQWADEYSSAELRLAALEVAAACKRLGIPATKIDGNALRRREAGICGHADVRDAFHTTTHYDPGPHFPWALFMTLVRAALVPPATTQHSTEEDDDMAVMLRPDKPMTIERFKGKRPVFSVTLGGTARLLTQREVDFAVKFGKQPPPADWPLEFVEGWHFLERADGKG